MKILFFSLIVTLGILNTAYADDDIIETPVHTKDESGGSYISYQDHKLTMSDKFFESMPLIGGKYEDSKENYCKHAVKDACVEGLRAAACVMNVNQAEGSCPAACKAWAKDCKDLVSVREVQKAFSENDL